MENKKNKIWWLVSAAVIVVGLALVLKFYAGASTIVWSLSDGGKWLLPLVGITALVDSINPCAFSILILTIAFLLSLGRLRSNILKIGGVYIFGVFTAYILIGLGLLKILHFFNTPHFMGKVGAGLLILLGLINLIQELFPNSPIKLRLPKFSHGLMARVMEKASVPTAFLLGILVGLCEFPCTGGPYLMILGLLHDQVTYLTGIGYLFLYNLIFVLPLVIILSLASHKYLLDRVEDWQNRRKKLMRRVGGLVMILLGVIIFLI
ncbi:MAG: GAP family protein [Patescibacteria group bacterium]